MAVPRRLQLAAVFVVLACLQAIGLYVFLKGFILTREVLEVKGRLYEPWERFPLSTNVSVSAMPVMVTQPAFKRVIIVVIDALRVDFLLDMPDSEQFYLNRIPIVQSLAHAQPENARVYQFRSDPPTTTTQRIKGIMTGSLPTFIDAGTNFASSAVMEDNVPRHLAERFEHIYFMGDETWEQLFPDTFHNANRTFGSDSFKMFDLHTVDNRILSHLWPLLPTGDWQVAIAHFLGVDHCGHTFGPSHANMAKKLTQMNGVLERIISHVDNDTLLAVFGDHGMSSEGNHGGESVEETMAGLFMYSGRSLTPSRPDGRHQKFLDRIHKTRSLRFGYDLDSITERLHYNAHSPNTPIVPQVYLAPTLSYLLHIPIPFSNLGGLIPDVVFPADSTSRLRNLAHMVEQFRMNALQVYDYLHQYAEHTHHPGFSPVTLASTVKHFMDAEAMMLNLAQQPGYRDALGKGNVEHATDAWEEQLEEIVLTYDAFITSVIKYCESIWAQFDIGCMVMGITLLGLCTLVSLWCMPQPRGRLGSAIRVGACVFAVGVGSAVLRYTVLQDWVRLHGLWSKLERADWVWASAALAAGAAVLSTKQSFGWRSLLTSSGDGAALLSASLVQALSLGSNSYIIWEDCVVRFLLASACLWWLLRTTSTIQAVYPLLLLGWVRLTSLAGQCREEQYPHCHYWQLSSLSLHHPGVIGGIALLALVLVIGLPRLFKQRIDTHARFTYQLLLVLVLTRLWHDTYESGQHESYQLISERWMNVFLPRSVYGIGVMLQMTSLVTVLRSIRTLRKEAFVRASWTTLVVWSTILAMLQPPLGGIIVLLTPLALFCLSQGDASSLLIRLTLVFHYGHHLFFVTGHQATFTSLPWKAAFIGFDDMNYYGGATLVALSTLTGPILSWLGWLVLLAGTNTPRDKGAMGNARQPLYFLVLFQALPTFLSSVFLLVLRRHLMTWKIFAPRFLLQALMAIGSHLAAIVLQTLVSFAEV